LLVRAPQMNVSLISLAKPITRTLHELKETQKIEQEKKDAEISRPHTNNTKFDVSEKFVVPKVKTSWTLKDAHYEAMEIRKRKIQKSDNLPIVLSAITGYSGFIPGKEANNVIGVSYRKANEIVAKEFMSH
jgi:hypothetical protein